MKELRVTLNHRINKDLNISTTFTHLLDDGADVAELGEQDAQTVTEYVTGFAKFQADTA